MNRFQIEIHEQPQALLDTARWAYGPEGHAAFAAIRAVGTSDLVLTGMGSSYFLARSAESLLASKGVRSRAVNAAELLHYGLSSIGEDSLLVLISQSGESYEIVRLLEHIPAEVRIVAITNERESTLGKAASERGVLLLTSAGREEMTSTKTFVTGYQMMYLLTCALADEDLPAESVWETEALAVKSLCDSGFPEAARLLGKAPFVQLVGRGPAYAGVAQSALMFMEAAHVPSSCRYGGEFRHGPIEAVAEGFAVVIFTHSGDATYSQMVALAGDVLRFGGAVVMISDREVDHDGRFVSIAVGGENPQLAPIRAVVPMQLIINDIAERKGLNAGDFSHGAKVTVKE